MPPHRHDGMYQSTEGHDGNYLCALWSWIRQPAKESKKMAARNDFHWLRFLPIGVYRIQQSVSFALRRSLLSFTKSVHSKSYAPKICDLVFSLVFALPPRLDCDLRRLLFQSSDIQTHWELGKSKLCGISLPCLAKTPSFNFFSLFASVFLTPSLSPGHGLLTLCMCDVPFCVLQGISVWKCVRVTMIVCVF